MKRQRTPSECAHEVAWNSLCAFCGARVDAASVAEQSDDFIALDHHADDLGGAGDSEYVKAAFLAHDPMLEVKKSYAEMMEKEAIRDLVRERKGILILDLDHTLFQVTLRPIPKERPDIETWNFATELAHSGRLLENKTYWFNLDSSPHAPPFFIHLRPGLYSFLETVGKMFELYAYTQGTSEYAKKILTGIDPKGSWFGTPSRLIAREIDPTTGSTIRKSLSRVFPSEEDLVLIVDDRDDVWDKRAVGQNLIKLVPYLFFQDLDREKLITMTTDVSFHPGTSVTNDKQLHYLELVLGDIHSEFFFGKAVSSLSEILCEKKKSLFSNLSFFPNEKINGNIFRIIKQFGGSVVDHGGAAIRLGEEIHPWFVLFCVSTLTVPSDVSAFALTRIKNEGITSVWECPREEENEEENLLQDLLAT